MDKTECRSLIVLHFVEAFHGAFFPAVRGGRSRGQVYKQQIPAVQAWRAAASRREARLRDACPACSGLEMKLILVPEGPRRVFENGVVIGNVSGALGGILNDH